MKAMTIREQRKPKLLHFFGDLMSEKRMDEVLSESKREYADIDMEFINQVLDSILGDSDGSDI